MNPCVAISPWTGLYIGLFLSLVSVGVCSAILFRINWLVSRLKHGASRLASGQLHLRLPIEGPPELAALAESLNQMAAQLVQRLEDLTRQRNEIDSVLASMTEGVLATDLDVRVLRLNHAAANLLAIDPDRAMGRTLHEVVRNTALQQFIAEVLATQLPLQGELTLRPALPRPEATIPRTIPDRPAPNPPAPEAPDAPSPLRGGATEAEAASLGGVRSLPLERDRFVRIQGAPLRDAMGTLSGVVVVLHDVTRLQQLENVRRDFVANVSHEIKTPVAAIKASAETILDSVSEDDQENQDAVRFLQIIVRQSDRLNALMDDLLALARLEQETQQRAVAVKPGRLMEVVQGSVDACRLLARDRGVTVVVEGDATLEAPVNAGLLDRAVINLVDNAIKYGRSTQGDPVVRVRVSGHGPEAIIAVTDDGPGIDAEHLPRIFERFYRPDKARSRAVGGTGLGLAIVKHVSQAHGGRVTVQSTPGQGSTFSIHLPRGP